MFKVNNKDGNSVVLVSLLLTLDIFQTLVCVSIVNFEHGIVSKLVPLEFQAIHFRNTCG